MAKLAVIKVELTVDLDGPLDAYAGVVTDTMSDRLGIPVDGYMINDVQHDEENPNTRIVSILVGV